MENIREGKKRDMCIYRVQQLYKTTIKRNPEEASMEMEKGNQYHFSFFIYLKQKKSIFLGTQGIKIKTRAELAVIIHIGEREIKRESMPCGAVEENKLPRKLSLFFFLIFSFNL